MTNYMRAKTMAVSKIGIIGLGKIGSSYAHALVQGRLMDELVLIDLDFECALALAQELCFAPFISGGKRNLPRIYAGHWKDMADADLIVIAAGEGRGCREKENQERNIAIYKAIFSKLSLARYDFSGVVVIAFDVNGVLQLVADRYSGLSKEKIIGCGAVMQTLYLQHLAGELTGVGEEELFLPVIGDGGMRGECFPLWSLARISHRLLHDVDERYVSLFQQKNLFTKVEEALSAIIEGAGCLRYAVVDALLHISDAVLRNRERVLTVSSIVDGEYGCTGCFSLPAVVGREGRKIVEETINEDELRRLLILVERQKNGLPEV